MDAHALLLFIAAIAIGSYIQAIAGFAMGLIVMGLAASFKLAPIPSVAAVITLTATVNVLMALHNNHHHIDWQRLRLTSIGQIPAIIAGVVLLDYLSNQTVGMLQGIIGAVIVFSGVLLISKPHPYDHESPTSHTILAGIAAGLLGGMFSTGAPPLVFHLYRQPVSIMVIRSTLLAIFAIAIAIRLGMIIRYDHITSDVVSVTLLSLPVIVGATWVGKHHPPPLRDIAMRRAAFAILTLLGTYTTLTA